MKRTILMLASLAVVLGGVGQAKADLITFDDLSDGTIIANGYAGLNWNNFYVLNTTYFEPSGYVNGVVSSPNVAYNAYGTPASFSSSSTFTFNSVYLTAAWNDGLSIEIQGYVGGLGGTLVDDQAVTVNTSGSSLFTFNWSGIDTVNFSSSGGTNVGYNGYGTQFVMDNLTINAPEPSGTALIGLSIVCLAVGYVVRMRKLVLA